VYIGTVIARVATFCNYVLCLQEPEERAMMVLKLTKRLGL
jgi:hypothetical protein